MPRPFQRPSPFALALLIVALLTSVARGEAPSNTPADARARAALALAAARPPQSVLARPVQSVIVAPQTQQTPKATKNCPCSGDCTCGCNETGLCDCDAPRSVMQPLTPRLDMRWAPAPYFAPPFNGAFQCGPGGCAGGR